MILRPLAILPLLLALASAASADKIQLRDGSVMTGSILVVQADVYLFRSHSPGAVMQTIPKAAVQTVFYDDPTQASRVLAIPAAVQRHAKGPSCLVRLLPTRPFGQTILDAAQNAKTSIWISAYYISGSASQPIKDFYAALSAKARQGLDVVILSEFGPGTSSRVREATYNFARELEQSGIRVLFIREHRILHKKMILIDDQIALLGSSNLTMAGTLQSDEMNVEIRQPEFVALMQTDFERLFTIAHTPETVLTK